MLAKKSKVAFKSVGVPRRNLSAAFSALTSFYCRERTANWADDLWFDNCFRTRKPLALHWTGTGSLYFFFLFSAFDYKKKIITFWQTVKSAGIAGQQSCCLSILPLPAAPGKPSLCWANFSSSCCPVGPPRHSLSTSTCPSLTLNMLHQPPLLHTTSLWGMALFLKENLLIFHWHCTPEQSFCSTGGSEHIKTMNSIPKLIPCPVWLVTQTGKC